MRRNQLTAQLDASGRLVTAVAAIIVAVAVTAALAAPPQAAAQPTTINVEIDWMATAGHSHRPTQAEMNAVVQMFACHGITLNAVIDDSIPHINVIPDSAGTNDFFSWSGTNSFQWYKNQYFNNTGGGWHYCIFGHQYDPEGPAIITGSSGLGETGGDDLIVTLGSFTGQIGTPFDRASTFAHELGHNLGLLHYAGADSSAGTNSPNYASIMSYQYQLRGVRSQMKCLEMVDSTALFKDLDYSNGRLPSLDENSLVETAGVGIRSLDWNCNGAINPGSVGKDLDGQPWCTANGTRGLLFDKNDWAALVDNAATGRLPKSEYEPCITAEEFEQYKMMSPSSCLGAVPTFASETCVVGEMLWVRPGYVGFEDGRGETPYNTFLEGYNAAPNNSVLYLQNGSLNMGGGLFTLSKPITLAGPGIVTITR